MLNLSFLFYGPPGCAKTLVASATINELKKLDPLRSHCKLRNAEILIDPYNKLRSSFATITRCQITDVLIEDVDGLLCGIRSQPAAWRYLLNLLKEPRRESTNNRYCTLARWVVG